MALSQLSNFSPSDHANLLAAQSLDEEAIEAALSAEAQLGYMVPSGRYWEVAGAFDKDKLKAIDDLWLSAALDGAPALA
jgi:hypothetical protein